MSTLLWSGDAATAAIRHMLGARLARAMGAAEDEMHAAIGTQGPPPSAPGDPPHMESQRLHDSLYIETDAAGLRALIGSTEEHAIYTEIGTDRMEARPWFLGSIIQTADDMARELAR